jgi:hypothetical protein
MQLELPTAQNTLLDTPIIPVTRIFIGRSVPAVPEVKHRVKLPPEGNTTGPHLTTDCVKKLGGVKPSSGATNRDPARAVHVELVDAITETAV